jgi:hypothetical protein
MGIPDLNVPHRPGDLRLGRERCPMGGLLEYAELSDVHFSGDACSLVHVVHPSELRNLAGTHLHHRTGAASFIYKKSSPQLVSCLPNTLCLPKRYLYHR